MSFAQWTIRCFLCAFVLDKCRMILCQIENSPLGIIYLNGGNSKCISVIQIYESTL